MIFEPGLRQRHMAIQSDREEMRRIEEEVEATSSRAFWVLYEVVRGTERQHIPTRAVKAFKSWSELVRRRKPVKLKILRQ